MGLDEEGSVQKKVNTRDELLVNILDVIVCIKKRLDALRRTTRHVLTRVAKCIDVDGGIFEHLIRYDIFFNCNWVVTRWQQYSTHLHTNNT